MNPFQEGGPGMYVLLLFAMVGFVAAVGGMAGLFFVKKPLPTFAIATVLLLMAFCTGMTTFAFWSTGKRNIDEAIMHVDPEYRRMIEIQGNREISWLWMMGGCGCVPVGLVGGIAMMIALQRHSQPKPFVE